MHAAHCYHRDIAPDNILLTAGGPLLLDFGAARRVIGDMTQALTVILKPGYAPVEQYAEVPAMTQGAWTDLYALACVVYYAITGRTPPSSVERLMDDSSCRWPARGRPLRRELPAGDRRRARGSPTGPAAGCRATARADGRKARARRRGDAWRRGSAASFAGGVAGCIRRRRGHARRLAGDPDRRAERGRAAERGGRRPRRSGRRLRVGANRSPASLAGRTGAARPGRDPLGAQPAPPHADLHRGGDRGRPRDRGGRRLSLPATGRADQSGPCCFAHPRDDARRDDSCRPGGDAASRHAGPCGRSDAEHARPGTHRDPDDSRCAAGTFAGSAARHGRAANARAAQGFAAGAHAAPGTPRAPGSHGGACASRRSRAAADRPAGTREGTRSAQRSHRAGHRSRRPDRGESRGHPVEMQ